MKTIYELNLFESINVSECERLSEYFTRVPGGWIRDYYINAGSNLTSVFIPFNNEYQEAKGANR